MNTNVTVNHSGERSSQRPRWAGEPVHTCHVSTCPDCNVVIVGQLNKHHGNSFTVSGMPPHARCIVVSTHSTLSRTVVCCHAVSRHVTGVD